MQLDRDDGADQLTDELLMRVSPLVWWGFGSAADGAG
jgi:hypothetical protein